jgi:probable FeS assembly SUF system protein SufT
MTTSPIPTTLTRDCPATTVPQGDRITLHAGAQVHIVQQLGGSITVRTERGPLARIAGVDGDALGLELGVSGEQAEPAEFDLAHVNAALDTVYDPEIPISIVQLGLVYRCEAITQTDGTRRVEIDMTMTAPGCGMGDVLSDDAAKAVAAVPGVDEVEVTLVWDPPWSMENISDAARLELGLL